jgi:hypothetical protein
MDALEHVVALAVACVAALAFVLMIWANQHQS